MKTFSLIAFLIFAFNFALAQKTEVRHSRSYLGGSENPVSTVEIGNASLNNIEKEWKSYLKKSKGKLSEDGDVYFVNNARIKSISSDTIDIWSTVTEAGKTVTISIAVNSNGTFISNYEGQQPGIDRYLYEFAVSIKKNMAKEELKAAEAVLKSKDKSYSKLENQNEKLQKSNEQMKNKIADNERTISKNKDQLSKNKQEIEAQRELVKEMEKRVKTVE